MRRTLSYLMVLAIGGGGLTAGYRLGSGRWPILSGVTSPTHAQSAHPEPNGAILYYRDPDGKPAYSASPAKTADGRDFRPVRDSEEPDFRENLAAKSEAEEPTPGERKVLYYRHPMGLPDTSPVPKKDTMGMDYVPVYEGEDDDGRTVKVSLGKLQRTGVRSEPVERRLLARSLRAPGTIQLDERRVAVVSLRAEAFVDKVASVTTGDRVRRGEPLLRLYSPDIAAAAAQYLSVVSQPSGSAPLIAEGARRRLENLAVPADVMAEIERTRKVPLSITWSAPRDGIVLERTAVEGARAAPGDALFRLADLSVVWALVDVAERDLASVVPGQSVTVRPRGYVDRAFTGKVILVYPQINRETRTIRVRVELENPDGILRPDMYVDAEITTGGETPVVAVPTSAVIDSGTRQLVILDKGNGRFEPRPVKLGRRGDGYVEVREGVSEGESVLVAANFLIDAESNLKAALRGLSQGDQPK
ncbi:efflux RND transporter periplasmic adaptor subunit [Chelatococcus sp. SYSU_G07232]|uniref:Efflux RND transporter periplasmic adaptor subunit n=1 Tax=Chelatococcus albus TaxID=3047466 RepID=A0ABT7ABQ8_9HYPH|nr:efflux RND transporter periplasmic adaptor subunit [Chelatococcus sp. SYSU_G07232]MDJ1156798.1 efflux RND transporter periplasmic adaptor subunit [Chelatococcus sp. SYSU_G07232]